MLSACFTIFPGLKGQGGLVDMLSGLGTGSHRTPSLPFNVEIMSWGSANLALSTAMLEICANQSNLWECDRGQECPGILSLSLVFTGRRFSSDWTRTEGVKPGCSALVHTLSPWRTTHSNCLNTFWVAKPFLRKWGSPNAWKEAILIGNDRSTRSKGKVLLHMGFRTHGAHYCIGFKKI